MASAAYPVCQRISSPVPHASSYSRFVPAAPAKALEQIEAWMEPPSLVLLSETTGYWEVFSRLLGQSKIAGPRVHDGRVAALCIHHGVRELLSADRDFSRFTDLRKIGRAHV